MTTDKKRIRRNHTAALKAHILAECELPDTSVTKVAIWHGINANIVHGWRKLAREQVAAPAVAASFVPLTIEVRAARAQRIDVRETVVANTT